MQLEDYAIIIDDNDKAIELATQREMEIAKRGQCPEVSYEEVNINNRRVNCFVVRRHYLEEHEINWVANITDETAFAGLWQVPGRFLDWVDSKVSSGGVKYYAPSEILLTIAKAVRGEL